MSLDQSAQILGIIGGITGPLGLLIAYLTYRRDRARIRVRLLREKKITQGPDDETVRLRLADYIARGSEPPMELYLRDPDKTWAILEIVNHGRRKVIIEKIGWTNAPCRNSLPAGYYITRGWLPKELDEAEKAVFQIDDRQVSNAAYVWAIDSTGRIYNGWCRGGWWKAQFCILRERLHLT
jgi:hypothetical protein